MGGKAGGAQGWQQQATLCEEHAGASSACRFRPLFTSTRRSDCALLPSDAWKSPSRRRQPGGVTGGRRRPGLSCPLLAAKRGGPKHVKRPRAASLQARLLHPWVSTLQPSQVHAQSLASLKWLAAFSSISDASSHLLPNKLIPFSFFSALASSSWPLLPESDMAGDGEGARGRGPPRVVLPRGSGGRTAALDSGGVSRTGVLPWGTHHTIQAESHGAPRHLEATCLTLSVCLPPGMPLRVIRLQQGECQRWRAHLEALYLTQALLPRQQQWSQPHTVEELYHAHAALSRSNVFVVATIGQEEEWRYLCGTAEIVCHRGALYVNGRQIAAHPHQPPRPRHSAPGGSSSRRYQAMATAPPTPPHAHQLIRRSSSLSGVLREAGSSPPRSTPNADTADAATSASAATALPSFMCPIGRSPMSDPVVCADGFSYERSAIERWLRRFPPPLRARSPCTNLVLPNHTLVPNHSLRAAIAEWAAMQSSAATHDGTAALPP
jgi:hypothetical protein